MSENPTPRGDGAAPRRATPAAVKLFVALGLGFALYQAVMFGVRLWVDHRIARTEGAALVEFSLGDLEGRTWRAGELRGRYLVLHFFRSRCEVCLAEKPTLLELERRLDPARVQLLSVLLDRVQGYDAELSARTLAAMGLNHPVLWADAAFVDAFHGAGWAHVTPVTYVIDEQGRIVHALRGKQSFAALEASLPAGALRPR